MSKVYSLDHDFHTRRRTEAEALAEMREAEARSIPDMKFHRMQMDGVETKVSAWPLPVDPQYARALRDVSLWVAEVAMSPSMDPHTLSALNAEIARLAKAEAA